MVYKFVSELVSMTAVICDSTSDNAAIQLLCFTFWLASLLHFAAIATFLGKLPNKMRAASNVYFHDRYKNVRKQ